MTRLSFCVWFSPACRCCTCTGRRTGRSRSGSWRIAADGQLDLRAHGVSRSGDQPARRARHRSRKRDAKRLGVKIVWSERRSPNSSRRCRPSAPISSSADFGPASSRREMADFVDYLTTGPAVLRPCRRTRRSPPSSLRQEGRDDAHTASGRDSRNGASRTARRTEARVQYVPGENSIDVRNQLKQAASEPRCRAARRCLRPAKEMGKYRVVGEPFSTGYQGICSGRTTRRSARL